jgi:hypothetical protein
MTVVSPDFKTVMVRNSYLFPQTSFWYISRNSSFCSPNSTLHQLRNVNTTINSARELPGWLLYINNKATQTDAWFETQQEHRLSWLKLVFRTNLRESPTFDFVHILSNTSITISSDAVLRHCHGRKIMYKENIRIRYWTSKTDEEKTKYHAQNDKEVRNTIERRHRTNW